MAQLTLNEQSVYVIFSPIRSSSSTVKEERGWQGRGQRGRGGRRGRGGAEGRNGGEKKGGWGGGCSRHKACAKQQCVVGLYMNHAWYAATIIALQYMKQNMCTYVRYMCISSTVDLWKCFCMSFTLKLTYNLLNCIKSLRHHRNLRFLCISWNPDSFGHCCSHAEKSLAWGF